MFNVCDVPDVFATGAALLEEAKSRSPPPCDAIRQPSRPWGRCAELHRWPNSRRWPPGPRRRGPEGVPVPGPRKTPAGSPVVRCCSTSRVVASQDVCDVARGAGRVEKYTDTDGRVWDAAAHHIFSCRAGAECFARQKGCSAQLARTSNARRAAPMCKFCRRQQLATNLAGPARRTVSARRARCGCGRGFLSDGAHAVAAVVAAGPAGSRSSAQFFFGGVLPDLKSGRAALKSGSRALPVAALRPRPKYVLFDRYAGAHSCLAAMEHR